MNSVHDSHSMAKNPTDASQVSGGEAGETVRRLAPQIALRSDGAFLLSVEDIPASVNLEHRQKWTGVIVSAEDMDLIAFSIANAEAEVATRMIARMSRDSEK